MSTINNIPANIINLTDGWIAIEHKNMLFVLDRTKKNKSLKRPRTVFSLKTANPSFSAAEIHDLITYVTTTYELYPWTTSKDERASIYAALNDIKNERYGAKYWDVIKGWYSNLKLSGINKDAFKSDIYAHVAVAQQSIQNSESELLKKGKEIEKVDEYIWSIKKDQKIRRNAIHEYRIEYNTKGSSFFVIADGYKFKSGVAIFSAKTKDECIEFIDNLTISKPF